MNPFSSLWTYLIKKGLLMLGDNFWICNLQVFLVLSFLSFLCNQTPYCLCSMRDPHVAGGFLLQKEDLWASCCQMMQILFFSFTSDFIPIVSIWNGSQCIPNNPAIINKICVVFLLRLIVTSARLFPLTEVAAWVRLLTMPIILEWVNKMTEIGIIYWNKRF